MSTIALHPGVYLHTVPTTQFATTRVIINFTNQLSLATIGGRVLASNMIETISQAAPTQAKFARQLSELYGADFSADVVKVGALHSLRLTLTLVDDAFASEDDSLLRAGFDFLAGVLSGQFGDSEFGYESTVFNRQKDISLDEIAGLQEDRGFYAARQAMTAYFESAEQALPAYGSIDLLTETTPQQAWNAFVEAKKADRIDIVVLGDVSESEVTAMVQSFGFGPRQIALSPYYQQAVVPEVKTVNAQAPINQARLVVAFQLQVPLADRFKAFVFNAIFGGMSTSRLFLNVRETAGMAYAISSDWNMYTGLLLVEAGVEPGRLEDTKTRILAELDNLQQQPISEEELQMMKALMTTDYQMALDNPAQVAERVLTQQLVGYATTPAEWTRYLAAVTAADVQAIANLVQPQLVYQLVGGQG